MKTLSHNQQIRVEGFNNWTKMTVGTAQGYATEYGNDPIEALNRAIKFGHDLAYVINHGSTLTGNYKGKEEEMRKKREDITNSIMISDGELVTIEGTKYRVKVMGERYSDPVHFIPA